MVAATNSVIRPDGLQSVLVDWIGLCVKIHRGDQRGVEYHAERLELLGVPVQRIIDVVDNGPNAHLFPELAAVFEYVMERLDDHRADTLRARLCVLPPQLEEQACVILRMMGVCPHSAHARPPRRPAETQRP